MLPDDTDWLPVVIASLFSVGEEFKTTEFLHRIRGLHVVIENANRFPYSEIYVSLLCRQRGDSRQISEKAMISCITNMLDYSPAVTRRYRAFVRL